MGLFGLAGDFAGDLFLAGLGVEGVDGGGGQPARIGLAHLPVGMPPRRDLGAVGDDQDLGAGGQVLQAFADGLGHGTADALIDLVEDHDRLALVLAAGQGRLHL